MELPCKRVENINRKGEKLGLCGKGLIQYAHSAGINPFPNDKF